jgi:hypothetical protein
MQPILAKLTSKNQLTLPKTVVAAFPGTTHFEVKVKGNELILVPAALYAHGGPLEEARKRVKQLGLDASMVSEAVAWVRKAKR